MSDPKRERPGRLRQGRDGLYLLVLTGGVVLSAVNTGNNLLYVLAAVLVSSVCAAAILAELTLRGLEVERRLVGPWQVGERGHVAVRVFTEDGRLPLLRIRADDYGPDDVLLGSAMVESVRPGGPGEARYQIAPERRGRQRAEYVELTAAHPLAPFKRRRRIPLSESWLVHPAPQAARAQLSAQAQFADTVADGAKARRGELAGLRDFHEGEDPRDIHWRASARAGRLVMRDYEGSPQRRLELEVPQAPPGAGLERRVSEAAWLARRALDQGVVVSLRTPEAHIPAGRGGVHLRRILDALAETGLRPTAS